MKKRNRAIIGTMLGICGVIYSAFAIRPAETEVFSVSSETEEKQQSPQQDTLQTRYPVSKPTIDSYQDLNQTNPLDLEEPENIHQEIEFDPITNTYILRSKVGDMEIGTPFIFTPEEYQEYNLRESLRKYWQSQHESPDGSDKKKRSPFSLTDMNFDLGPAEKIFGPGGVQIKTQGYAEITFGIQNRILDNPTTSQKNRNKTTFKFDETVQMNVTASVGDKLNFGMNYNTDATFDFDQQQIKLQYEGKEDEIIKYLEAGNISMYTTNSLIRGGSSLFGIRADMQFGKLKVSALASQQQSQTQSVSLDKGAQLTSYEITADQYDENRHFFFTHHFRDNYDKWISKLPYITSGILVKKIEVWVTNKRANYEDARSIIAFADLGENKTIKNPGLWGNGIGTLPANAANNLYSRMTTEFSGARDISKVTEVLGSLESSGFYQGVDYEKIENARKLSESEYTYHTELGYISLNTALQPDEVLAVAVQYTYQGKEYQIGEFSSDNIPAAQALFLKLLKNTNLSPNAPTWNLMMKNIYSLGAYQVQADRFVLNVAYQSDTAGVYLNYIPETIAGKTNQTWLRLLNLDRLNSTNKPQPDGFFDFVEGYTVNAQNGRIIFPMVEPFGEGLREAIGNDEIANKYIYQELYDSTLTVARQIAEKNKFILRGEYKGNSSDVIQLNGTNIPRGSVTVTAGGVTLVEGTDYTVNYTMGEVRIINPSILSAGNSITASYESQSLFNLQRKTLLGLNVSYDFSENFSIGGTIMNLTEKPLTTKVNVGDESVNNTLWGLNTSFRTQSQVLTNLIDKLPFVEATAPSQISLNAEFAQLIPGHAGGISYSYIDDFESTQTGWSLTSPYEWSLASTPKKFPEADASGKIEYGMNRSLLAWYIIDGMFTNRNSSLTPSHIKNDLDQLSDPRVREVYQTELFPDKETLYNEASTLSIFNLAFYPQERGPYNLDTKEIDPETGFLTNPKKRWGGIMRRVHSSYTDFEKNNFEYIEFWLMDPFRTSTGKAGGELYFDLGDISEDILKDGKKFYENGIVGDGDMSKVEETVWGYVPTRQALVYAFDSQVDIRKQDVGLNGLSTEQEFEFSTYKNYLDELRRTLTPAAIARMEQDQFSPFNDPAGDNYHHFRGADYDEKQASILERYKRYNGTEGNSVNLNENSGGYTTAAKVGPDVEDINEDFTLNELEQYFQYKVEIDPDKMYVGQNFITDVKTRRVQLRNGETEDVNWYQFKIPLQNYTSKEGNISNFKSIRFIRMFLTQFEDTTVLRFGTLQLVRGEWRKYEQDLNNPNLEPIDDRTLLEVYSVNLEENGSRKPVNYVLPPGISRVLDPSQPQLRQNNEQSLSLRVSRLSPGDARAVYKSFTYDMRQYKRLQMFVHAEKFVDDTDLSDGQMAVFIRLGSDYKNNYYEYEVPVNLTPERSDYNTYNTSDQLAVWPSENMIDLLFEKFTDLKLERNEEKRKDGSNVTFTTAYSVYDSDKPRNKITVMGNPSLSEVKTIMIGVRNNSNTTKSVEVWVNELRLTDFNEDGGWAARGNLNIGLSDIGMINLGAHIETVGFGGIEESVSQRRLDDYYLYNFTASLELGRFLPKAAKITAPFYYSYSKQINNPKYNPLDGDILLKLSLDAAKTKAEKDSIKNLAQDKITNSSLSLSGFRVNIQSKNPMPYDPANFSFSYSRNSSRSQDASTAWELTKDFRFDMLYSYSPAIKPWEPFSGNKSKSPFMKPIQAINLNYIPNSFSFNSSLYRNYYEIQLRDMSDPGSTNYENVPISYKTEFYWNRGFDVRWDISRSLQVSFNNNTMAEILEPNVVVNKELYPDEYKIWKDSVWQSIRNFGDPLSYAQTFNVTYNLPFGVIPIMDWVTSTVKYTATYTWDRGSYIEEDIDLGNTINSNRSFQIDGTFNLEKLYNKSPFLKKANDKFSQRSTQTRQQPRRPAPKKFEQQITLSVDSTITVTHNLKTKNIRVRALRPDSTVYPIKYKKVGNNAIRIQNMDSLALNISIVEGPDPGESLWYKIAQYGARGLMMFRRATIMYNETNTVQLPGFMPGIGDFFGQANGAPGWDFAFGFIDGYDYVMDAYDKGWLTNNENVTTPAVLNYSKDFSATLAIEPIKGLKIDLNGRWNHIDYTQVQYMYTDDYGKMPETRGGNFTMTTIALKSAFLSSNGHSSEAFNRFLENREIIINRITNMFNSVEYPAGIFDGYNGAYSDNPTAVDPNSPEVMIPAFLAAYTTGDPNSIKLTALPSLASMLPNWKISYDGLSNIPWIKQRFKSVTLNHSYRCTYNVGSYTTYQSWVPVDGQNELGFLPDVQDQRPVPSFQYDIASVSVTESFAPLIGVTVTFINNISCTAEYKRTRTLSLNMSNSQILEALGNEFVLGLGYKITNFNNVLKMNPSKNVNHDLTVRADVSYNRNESIVRKIEEEYSDPVSGTQTWVIKLAADYNFSKALTIRAYFDRQMNTPLVSSTSYPITTTDFGIAMRFSLTR